MTDERESEERTRCSIPGLNRVILDSVAGGVFTVDPDFRITSFNRAAEEITGVPREEALGSLCCDVFRTIVCEDACVLREAMAAERPIVNRAISMVRADGCSVPISVSASTLRDDDGDIISELFGVVRGAFTVVVAVAVPGVPKRRARDDRVFRGARGRGPRRHLARRPRVRHEAGTGPRRGPRRCSSPSTSIGERAFSSRWAF